MNQMVCACGWQSGRYADDLVGEEAALLLMAIGDHGRFHPECRDRPTEIHLAPQVETESR